MWFGFQFNLSDSSDDELYRLVLDPEGQGHQWKMISTQLGSYFGAPKKKLSRGCLRVRPDANANADADAEADADAWNIPLRLILNLILTKSNEPKRMSLFCLARISSHPERGYIRYLHSLAKQNIYFSDLLLKFAVYG